MPDFRATYRDRQKAYVNAMGLNEGDYVYLTHSARSGECGWEANWDSDLNDYIGKKMQYTTFSNGRGLMIKHASSSNGWYVPYYVVIPAGPIKAVSDNSMVLDGEVVTFTPNQIDMINERILCRK